MIYNDLVYGKINIKEPVISELINSGPVQRLKKITQHGPSVYNKHYKKKILTRFEHSLGVYILLNKLSTSKEEQIAGLLHDIGHTVFSHTIDFLFPEENGEYDKKYHRQLILKSEVPGILKKYKINLQNVLDDTNFSVLEKPLPDLCADRIDYFLRDPHLPESFDKKKVLSNLVIFENKIVFSDTSVALYFSDQYLRMHDLFWANPLDELLYFIMVDIFKFTLDKKIIKHKDLFLTEEEFLEKIKNFNNKEINKKLNLIENLNKNQVRISKSKIPNSYFIKSYIRVIDPLVLIDNKTERLSSINEKYKKHIADFYKEKSKARWIGYEE